jgi:hypothetical protein
VEIELHQNLNGPFFTRYQMVYLSTKLESFKRTKNSQRKISQAGKFGPSKFGQSVSQSLNVAKIECFLI